MTNRRDFIRGAALAAGAAAVSPVRAEAGATPSVSWSYDGRHAVRLRAPSVREPVTVRFLADTHLALHDERDAAFADNYRRMAKHGAEKSVFEKTLPKPGDCDLLVLGGDNISFPTLANVEYLTEKVAACGVSYAFVAGNHDWHFEGDAGSDFEQRARWIDRRLKPLYQGRDPLACAVTVKGLKVILIDNSLYHVTPEQLAFWQRETADGRPVILFLHIPFWQEGWSVTTCACPHWGAANDPYWQIERRERWAEKLLPSTFAFREAVLATPSLVGVVAGHVHRFMAAGERGRPQLSVPENRTGGYFDILIQDTESRQATMPHKKRPFDTIPMK